MLNEYLLTDTSPASATTAASTVAVATGLEKYDWFTVDSLLLGGTGGTLDVYIQRYCSKLAEWRDWYHFGQVAAGGTSRNTFDSKMSSTTVVSPGSGTSPSIAAGTLVCSAPGDQVRLVFVAGAGTSAGAVQKVVLYGWRRRGG